MKKRNFKLLSLNKKSISNLSSTKVKGRGFTSGCTDGCGSISVSHWNCTQANCTADCNSLVCDTDAFCTLTAPPPQDTIPDPSPVGPEQG